MACRLFHAKPLSEPMLKCCYLDLLGTDFQWNFKPNSCFFIRQNAFEIVICDMAAICVGLNVLTSKKAITWSNSNHDAWRHMESLGPNTCILVTLIDAWVSELHEPRIFYPSGHWPETVTNAHISAHFRWSLGASVISTHIRTEGLYVKTTIIHQLKRMCVPDCAYRKNMFMNSIYISLYEIQIPVQQVTKMSSM